MTRELLAEREDTVLAWSRDHGLPFAFVLAGGCIGNGVGEAELVDLHCLTIEAAARNPG